MSNDKTIKLSDIKNADFNDGTEPRDERLIELLGQAYRGEIDCYMAIVEFDTIKPYSDYKPTISDAYRDHFIQKYSQGSPPPLYVYGHDGALVMSDDYSSYNMYKTVGAEKALCLIIGEPRDAKGIIETGKPFKLPPPSIEQI